MDKKTAYENLIENKTEESFQYGIIIDFHEDMLEDSESDVEKAKREQTLAQLREKKRDLDNLLSFLEDYDA